MSRILVVEDSPDIRVLIRMLLESVGHEVWTANDGRAGVEAARSRRPDLVLMDLSLPLLSGWEATREIKSDPSTASIPVLAVTAHAMQGDRERALAAGCDGFVAKPIDEETFASLIDSHLHRREGKRSALTKNAPAPETGARVPKSVPGRILLVDDQPEVVQVIRMDLEAEGHQVVSSTTAEDALRQFHRDPTFDLAVIDVMLGQDSGYLLAAQLIGSCPEYLPVLLVTAGTIDRERGYEAGADDFIGKPIDSAELKARVRSLIRIGRSIRDQGRAMKEHAEAYEKLAELDRLKSDFLSTVSHELRTPLNTIILLSHLIEREGTSPADEQRRLHDIRVIRDSAEALLRMINNILDLAKLEAGQRDLHPQRIELSGFLRETVDMLEPQARSKGIEIALEIGEGLPAPTVLDREKLSRVLINLLSNAVNYTQVGRVVLRASRWQDSIAFEVEDTGTGVPPHLIAAAFEPFRQIRTSSSEARRGTGLGLPISKQLVELMGGDLLFDSREGQGTRVSFTLPQLPELVESESVTERQVPGPTLERVTSEGPARSVLIIEDDASSRYGLKSLLESEGYRVAEAGSLGEANRVTGQARPDAIILDITLPDGDGAEWVRLLQKKGPLEFPVIVLTGMTADEDRRRIEQSGVSAVLQKPINVNLLFEALRDCLAPKGDAAGRG